MININTKYTKKALIEYFKLMPVGYARCVIVLKNGSYRSVLPRRSPNAKREVKGFAISLWGDRAYFLALQWSIDNGCRIWGEVYFSKYMYREVKSMGDLYKLEDGRKNKTKEHYHYGVAFLGNAGYRGTVQLPSGKKIVKSFSYSAYGDQAFDYAYNFVEYNGIHEWGSKRWENIKNGGLYRFSSKTCGVSVNKRRSSYTTEFGQTIFYELWVVSWREKRGESESSKCFNEKKYGSCDKAHIAAEYFAATKRAERTLSELNLPQFLVERLLKGIRLSDD